MRSVSMSSIRSVASSIPCNRAIRSSDHAEVTTTPRASRIRRLSSRIRMIRSFALSKSCLHGSTKGKSTLQAHPGFLSLHRSRSMQLLLAGPSGNLWRSSHKPMPVITAGRTRSNIRWPFVVVVAVMAHPLAFSRGIAQEGHAHPGGRTRLQPIYHMAAALYVTLRSATKKKRPDGSRRFSQFVLEASWTTSPFWQPPSCQPSSSSSPL